MFYYGRYRDVFDRSHWGLVRFFLFEAMCLVPFILGGAPLYHDESPWTGRYAGRRAYCFLIAVLADFAMLLFRFPMMFRQVYQRGGFWLEIPFCAAGMPIIMIVLGGFAFFFIGGLASLFFVIVNLFVRGVRMQEKRRVIRYHISEP